MNVFKLVLLNLVILMCSFQIIAQEKVEPKKMNYGIGFGLNYSSYHTDSDELSSIYSELLGFSIVVSAERKLSDRFKVSYVVADWVDIGVKYNYGLRTIFDLIFTDINGNPIGAQETTNRYLQLAIIIRH